MVAARRQDQDRLSGRPDSNWLPFGLLTA